MAATVIVFAGEYDISCKDQLRTFLETSLEPNLVFDLSEVTYVDSSFLNELVTLHRRRREKNFAPEIVVLRHPMIKRIFDILHLESLFQVVETLDEALAHNGNALTIEFAFRCEDTELLA